MLIQHKQTGGKGVFFLAQEGKVLAEMVYTMPSHEKMIIEHTDVSDELRGQSVGFELVKTAVEFARTNNLKIIPLCPFTKSVIDKKPDFQDVLA